MFKSIRGRLAGTYLLLALIIVVITEGLFLTGIRYYYLKNIRDILEQQARLAANFYEQYMGKEPLEYEAQALLEGLSGVSVARQQVFSASGSVLADSMNELSEPVLLSNDLKGALAGKITAWQGRLSAEPVIAVSAPIKNNGAVIGVIRYMSSLKPFEKMFWGLFSRLLFLGAVIVILVVLIGFGLAKTIAAPVEEITAAAAKIAAGNLSVQVKKRYEDEVGHLADTLNHMAGELGRLERLKNEFISSVSHELRTPLTSIKGWVVTLEQKNSSRQEQEQGLQIIHQETDRLTAMVEELLDFSRLQSGRLVLSKREVDLKALIENTVVQMSPRAKRLGLNFTFKLAEGLKPVLADPDRLKQVLINLLDNSFKFTPAGGTVEIKTTQKENETIIQVTDSGSGIPPEELLLIGQNFYQGRTAKSGSGLGLSLSREITRLHGGSLEIKSKLGIGTEVCIYLPLTPR
ncbi:MAG: ATP-binding protein [Peptococcaceae bacterium]